MLQRTKGFSLGLQPTTSLIRRYPSSRALSGNLKSINDYSLVIKSALKSVQIQDGFYKNLR